MLLQVEFQINSNENQMQSLILLVGEEGSAKDCLYQLINCQQNEQVLFENIRVKQLINKSGLPDILLINFPELSDIQTELNQLLSLSKHIRITQIVICMQYRRKIKEEIDKIKKKYNQILKYTETKIITFFVNDYPQKINLKKDSDILYLNSLKNLTQDDINIITERFWYDSQHSKSYQYNLLTKDQHKNEDLLAEIVNEISNQFNFLIQDKQNCYFFQKGSNMKSLYQNISKKKTYSSKLKISELYCDLLHLVFFSQLDKEKIISIESSQNFQLINLNFCCNCSILYEQTEQQLIQNTINLFKTQQQRLDTKNFTICINCKKTGSISKYLGQMLTFLQQTHSLLLIDEYYQEHVTTFQSQINKNANQIVFKQEQYQQKMEIEIEIEIEQVPQAMSDDVSLLNQDNLYENSLKILLLTNEYNDKTKIFKKICKSTTEDKNKQFIKGYTSSNVFHLVNAPIFAFDEDRDQQEQLFAEYFNNNRINYIFFCLHYQRTSLMKDRVLQMLKFLPQVNKEQMGLLIITNTEKNKEDELEIIESLQRILKQVIVITENDDVDDIINKIRNCVQNIQISEELSFKDTIFDIQEDEATQILLQQQFQLLSQKVENDYKEQQQRQILYYQQLLQKKQEFQDQIKQEKKKFLDKKQELFDQYQKQIQESETQLKKKVQHYELSIEDIDGQLQSIGKLYSIQQKETNAKINNKRKKFKKNRN